MNNKRRLELKCPWLAAEDVIAEVKEWLVAENDPVEIDQDIMVMLLDGAEFKLPSPADGRILSILAEPGEIIEPDQILAIIGWD